MFQQPGADLGLKMHMMDHRAIQGGQLAPACDLVPWVAAPGPRARATSPLPRRGTREMPPAGMVLLVLGAKVGSGSSVIRPRPSASLSLPLLALAQADSAHSRMREPHSAAPGTALAVRWLPIPSGIFAGSVMQSAAAS